MIRGTDGKFIYCDYCEEKGKEDWWAKIQHASFMLLSFGYRYY